MGYREIQNLYKAKTILLFKQCYAMEKIHGTSAHIGYKVVEDKLFFFSGGEKYDKFVALFDQEKLLEAFRTNAKEHPGVEKIVVYGEAYGGKQQGMSHTYGPDLKFIAFEVCINENSWMGVEQANRVATRLGFEFVHYEIVDCTEEALNAVRDADSIQAVRNGMGSGHKREGVVLRPLIELVDHNSGRIMAKHKTEKFEERMRSPKVFDPEADRILEEAKAVADEWVVPMRLEHVLDHLKAAGTIQEVDMKDTNKIIQEMIADVYKEAKGEIVESKDVQKAIGKKTVALLKEYIAKGTF